MVTTAVRRKMDGGATLGNERLALAGAPEPALPTAPAGTMWPQPVLERKIAQEDADARRNQDRS